MALLSPNISGHSIFPFSPPSSSSSSTICSRVDIRSREMTSKRFAVLKTGNATPYTERSYGGYAKMLENLLKDEGERWEIFSVIDGDFCFEPHINSFDGFVITGSSSDAHADSDWILRLSGILRLLHHNKKKVLGICFGHQILARALGGKTGRAEVGWELGVKSLRVDNKMVSKLYGFELTSSLNAIESHRDQVSCVPPGGVVLASSDKTEIEMFSLGDHVLGIQGHPEFSKDVILDIIDGRLSTNVISAETANEAIKSLERRQVDQESLKALCKTFLKK
ncbi:gamma-glutamyl peptidase 3-like [Tasmannia lanceolata]|uniref:gamma-glutamyl peptidase 3-like n=1 Tax=Tasmannia lanceolata TaxID=3420 RepID=UPI004062C667